jgi:hypothetical protein
MNRTLKQNSERPSSGRRSGLSKATVARVFASDRGICAKCGRDMERTRRDLETWLARYAAHAYGTIPRARLRIGRLWDVDHIVPLAEGGTDDPNNLRTLCLLGCHQEATRRLAKRRAIRRRRHAYRPNFSEGDERF